MAIVRNKAEFKRLSNNMKLGNRFRVWNTVQELRADNYTGKHVYIRGPFAGWPWMVPWCPNEQLEQEVSRIVAVSGTPETKLQFVEVAAQGTPRRLNFEAMRDERYLTLTHGNSWTLSLREDLEQNGKLARGLEAWQLFRNAVPPEELDMFLDIWDRYPAAIIESVVYDIPVGVLGKHSIIFEVRNY